MKQKLLFLLVALLSNMTAWAQFEEVGQVTVNNLTYGLVRNDGLSVAAVFADNKAQLTGAVVILPTINYKGEEFTVVYISEEAFRGSSGLTSITIPSGVTTFGYNVFYGCTGLTSVNFAAGSQLTSIESGIFAGLTSLTSITLPESLESIGKGAFYGCSGLTNIEIPNSVTSIGDYAFNECTGLTNIEIHNSVTSIGEDAFYQCI